MVQDRTEHPFGALHAVEVPWSVVHALVVCATEHAYLNSLLNIVFWEVMIWQAPS